jgi:hypothetical protein
VELAQHRLEGEHVEGREGGRAGVGLLVRPEDVGLGDEGVREGHRARGREALAEGVPVVPVPHTVLVGVHGERELLAGVGAGAAGGDPVGDLRARGEVLGPAQQVAAVDRLQLQAGVARIARPAPEPGTRCPRGVEPGHAIAPPVQPDPPRVQEVVAEQVADRRVDGSDSADDGVRGVPVRPAAPSLGGNEQREQPCLAQQLHLADG